MKTFSKLTLASVSVLALLTLAACGNSKDKTDSSSSTTSSSKVTKESSSTDSSASVKVNKDNHRVGKHDSVQRLAGMENRTAPQT